MFFEPLVKKDYEWINAVNESDYEIFSSLNGASRGKSWKPVLVRRVRADNKQKGLPSDFPWLGGVLIFRKKVLESMKEILEDNGEILPLQTEDGIELFVHNTKVIPNALDENRSELVRFPMSDRIMRIKKIAFNEEAIKNADMFRLPLRSSETYVSKRFVDVYSELGLVGLEFKPVWPSD